MKKYTLKNLDCASCAAKIEANLSKLGEVKFVNVNFANSTMTIDTDNLEKVKTRIKEIEPEVEVEDNDKEKTVVSTSELAENKWTIIKAISGLLLLIAGMVFEEEIHNTPFHIAEYLVFGTGYLIVGWKVISSAVKNIVRGQFFDEQFLMAIATLGAFAIDQMSEAVAVMLFYVIGELFQDIAVNRSRKSIKAPGLTFELTTRAVLTLALGAENTAQYLYIYFRWYSTKRPKLSGPWSELNTTLIL